MARRLRFVLYSLVFVVALVIIAGAALTIRLVVKPISLTFLTPAMERALARAASPLTFELGDTELAWRGGDIGIGVQARDVRVRTPDGQPVARLPEIVLDFSPGSLFRGDATPSRIVLVRPSLHLTRDRDGRLRVALGDTSEDTGDSGADATGDAFRSLLSPIGAGGPMDAIATVRIEDGRVDLTRTLADGTAAPAAVLRADGTLNRTRDAAEIDARVGLDESETPVALAVRGRSSDDGRTIGLVVTAEGIRPVAFADAVPALAALGALDLPLSGRIGVTIDRDGRVRGGEVEMSGGQGHLRVTEDLASLLSGRVAPQTIPVDALTVKGAFDADAGSLAVETLDVTFGADAAVVLPEPVRHTMPIARLRAEATSDGETATLSRLDIDLTGPTLSATGEATGLKGEPRVALELTLADVPTDDLAVYWPPSAAPGAYKWCTRHLSHGRISSATASLAGRVSGGGFTVERLDGRMAADGVVVDYLAPLPAVRDAAATATFDLEKLVVSLVQGHSDGLRVSGGTVVITDFHQKVETIDLDLTIDGTVPAALDLLSRKPLRYTQAVGLTPRSAEGMLSTRVRLAFPLLKDLPLKQVDLAASATLDDVFFHDVFNGVDATDGSLSLDVDTERLDLAGNLRIAGMPGHLTWRETFSGAKAGRAVVFDVANGAIADVKSLLPAGVADPYLLGGTFAGTLNWSVSRADEAVNATLDLAGARLAVPEAGWKKSRGDPATLDVEARLANGIIRSVPRLSLDAAGLSAGAWARFDSRGRFERADIGRLSVGRTRVRGGVARLGAGWDVRVDGDSLDLGPLLAAAGNSDLAADTGTGALTLSADVNRVWFPGGDSLRDVKGRVVRDSGRWQRAEADATVDGAPITVRLAPGEDRTRTLTVTADNAGATAQTIGLFSDMRGGKLTLDAIFDDGQPQSPLRGTLRVHDYQMVNAPILARILSIMALTGIIDALRGDGIYFSRLDVPFVKTGPLLQLTDARAYGPSIGLTASGQVQTADNWLFLRGTAVPFYLINSALGRLPVVGGLFTGGEKGGGLFAATYTVRGSLDDPQVSVNPLSILGPGVLRRLFTIFDAPPPAGLDDAAPPVDSFDAPSPPHP
jgi:Protein of unknown function/AsmA-like C-terminal region